MGIRELSGENRKKEYCGKILKYNYLFNNNNNLCCYFFNNTKKMRQLWQQLLTTVVNNEKIEKWENIVLEFIF